MSRYPNYQYPGYRTPPALPSKKPKKIGGWIVLLVIAALWAGYGGIRYLIDKPVYEAAHAAYLKGDCSTAIPKYEQILQAFSLSDFGKLRHSGKLEKLECADLQTARSNGIAGLYNFVLQDHPESSLTAFAKGEATSRLGEIYNSSLVSADSCSLRQSLLDENWFPDLNDSLPRFDYFCGVYYLERGDGASAFTHFANVLHEAPEHSVTDQIFSKISSSREFCSVLDQVALENVITNQGDLYAALLKDCGDYFVSTSEYDAAVGALQEFLDRFSDRPEAEDVTRSLAAALIGQAKASGSGTIEVPDSSGYAPGGVSRVIIQNDSPHPLRIVFSGPDARIEYLDPCPGCNDYSYIGPIFCPEKGPIGTYDLGPGTYDVMVQTMDESNISPFTGNWSLADSKKFYSCFFVVSRMSY